MPLTTLISAIFESLMVNRKVLRINRSLFPGGRRW